MFGGANLRDIAQALIGGQQPDQNAGQSLGIDHYHGSMETSQPECRRQSEQPVPKPVDGRQAHWLAQCVVRYAGNKQRTAEEERCRTNMGESQQHLSTSGV